MNRLLNVKFHFSHLLTANQIMTRIPGNLYNSKVNARIHQMENVPYSTPNY